MKISLAQHGGLVAIRRPPLVIDSATLDEAAAAELRALAGAAATAAAPARNKRARDEMSYTITIEDSGKSETLSQSDTAMSAEFDKLLTWLQHHPGK
ncbi:MAG: protealysin inhibitor emfourin [Bradyrhizobium sp.]